MRHFIKQVKLSKFYKAIKTLRNALIITNLDSNSFFLKQTNALSLNILSSHREVTFNDLITFVGFFKRQKCPDFFPHFRSLIFLSFLPETARSYPPQKSSMFGGHFFQAIIKELTSS